MELITNIRRDMMSKHPDSNRIIPIERDNPSIRRNTDLCIKCGQCKKVCEEKVAVGGMYDLESTGDNAICINCGQCANVCPVGAITEKYDYLDVRGAIKDPDKVVIFSTSPSVRVGLGEEFGLNLGEFVQGKMVGALRALGGDYVLDTNFSADLTIMEEANELIDRVINNSKPLPQFTSCCPAWVKFVETFYPDLKNNLSTAKSPIGMQGPTIKTFFAKENNIDPKKIVNVAVTPCTAKKFEIKREEMCDAGNQLGIEGMRDMDYVITTRELARWIKEEHINFGEVADSEYDKLMGEASGAGIIFGNTGGVMEAAVRTAYNLITKENPPKDLLNFKAVRGMDGIRETSITINGKELKVAVIHEIYNAKKFIEKLSSGEIHYDFIEVMTCRGGCIGGGGQPKKIGEDQDAIREARIQSLYSKDRESEIRNSYDNPEIKYAYEKYYKNSLSPLAETILHTEYKDRSSDLGEKGIVEKNEKKSLDIPKIESNKYQCIICGYIHEGEMNQDYLCPICNVGTDQFKTI